MVDWSGLILFFAPWVLAPALPLAFTPRGFRIMIFVLALVFGFGISFVMELGGPDSPGLILPFLGFAVAISAVLAEGVALAVKRIWRPTLRD